MNIYSKRKTKIFTAFFKNLSDEIIKSLRRKKREPLAIVKRLEITSNIYENMKKKLFLSRVFRLSSDLIDIYDIKIDRYFNDGSSNQLTKNTFKAKVLKKNKQLYYEKKNKKLIQKHTKERFFFVCKYQKTENTSFQNKDI